MYKISIFYRLQGMHLLDMCDPLAYVECTWQYN
jgi:hypothetical protein